MSQLYIKSSGGGGSGITTIDLDSGSITGSTVTLSGGSTGLTTTAVSATEGDLTGTLVVAHGGTGDTSFTVYAPVCGGTTSTGVLQSAATGISTSGHVLTSTGSSSLPTWQAPAASPVTFTGDSGTPFASSSVTFTGAQQSPTVKFNANSPDVQLLFQDANQNITIGLNSPAGSDGNVIIGSSASFLGNPSKSVILGQSAANSATQTNSVCIGYQAGQLTSGSSNIYIGLAAGSSVGGSENNNIIIGNLGVASDSATIRLGTVGTQTHFYAAGIAGVSVSNLNIVTIDTTTGQLGSTAASSFIGSWVDQTTTPITMTTNTGYTSDDGSTLVVFTLPTTASIGDWIEINGKGSGLWTIHQAAGQQIFISPNSTTLGAGGSLSSVNQYDCVRLRCIAANTTWVVVSQQSTGLTVV